MFNRLFGRTNRKDRLVVDALYGEIVAAARQPVFYADWGVPDTPLGRFEMLSLHLFLLLHRLRGEAGAARGIAQELTDEFFKEVEHSIRELGVGDLAVPKRMKKLAGMFYGRAASYEAALDANDAAALAAALARNVRPTEQDWSGSRDLAAYVMTARDALGARPLGDILLGRVSFTAAFEVDRGAAA